MSDRDESQHFIAPVCGTCGREIDKRGAQWFHVFEQHQLSPSADPGFPPPDARPLPGGSLRERIERGGGVFNG